MSPILLAELDPDTAKALDSWQIMTPATRERLVIFSAIGVVALLLLLWAAFLRKKHRHRHSHHHGHHHSSRPAEVPAVAPVQDAVAPPVKRRRARRLRRRHRPRNPTLAETGGLPPVRPEHPPGPLP